MKKGILLKGGILCLLFGLVLTQCNEQVEEGPGDLESPHKAVEMEPNPSPEELGEIPEATVELKSFPTTSFLKVESLEEESSLTPELLEETLKAGESLMEEKLGTLTGAPPKGDIMFMVDLTGSMGGELNNAKVNSINIMNQIKGVIPDSEFGVISHMDYQGYYSGCGYSATYGGGPDYPYSLDQSLTGTTTDVSNAINALSLGYGYDGPENYTRPLYETTADASIGWRTGSKKIVVAWLDNIPHDCDVFGIISGSGSTGPDPGRDGVAGTADDLAILPTLAAMDAQNITLIVLYSGSSSRLALWQAYAQETGGDAFQINSNGTIPGGIDIGTFIADLIEEEVSQIDELTLEVCTPGFESWLTDVSPASYTDIDLDEVMEFNFDITLTVPEGTADGVYEFDVCLVGDGVEYGRQHVKITVLNTIEVALDVHPTSCPNPINRKSKGMVPVAILGTADFDVSQIDPATLLLEGLSPVRYAYEDVASPYEPFIGKELDKLSCTTAGPDGFEDLTLKFDAKELAAFLAGASEGEVLKLTLTGELFDGTEIVGEDVIIVVK